MSGLDSTYGALFIGVLVSAVLFGVTILQVFIYFQQYPTDRWWGKLAVCWLWFLDALHFSLSAHFIYFYLVTNFHNPSALLIVTWSYKLRTIVDGLVVMSVHSLYTFRLWTLRDIDEGVEPFKEEARRWSSQKTTLPQTAARWIMQRIVPYFVGALVVIGYALVIVMCTETYRLDTFDRLSHAPFATYVPLVCATLTDIVIAGSLCYFLARCQTEFGAMNGVLRKLMFYTVNTGIVTSLCSIIAISMMIAYPATFITAAIEFLVIKLYINSFLAMLNARGSKCDGLRCTSPGIAPNTSFILQNIGVPERKLVFPPSSSSVLLGQQTNIHVEDPCPPELYAFRFPTDSLTSEELFPGRAIRLSHSDVALPEYDESLRLTHPFAAAAAAGTDVQAQIDHLAVAPPMPDAISPKSRPIDVPYPSSLVPENQQRKRHTEWHTTLSTIPSVSSHSQSHQQQCDYPSPPERALSLSPLNFGAQQLDGEGGVGREDAPPIVSAQRDSYSQMVRSARSWGWGPRARPRRALFDAERGVAGMWGLRSG